MRTKRRVESSRVESSREKESPLPLLSPPSCYARTRSLSSWPPYLVTSVTLWLARQQRHTKVERRNAYTGLRRPPSSSWCRRTARSSRSRPPPRRRPPDGPPPASCWTGGRRGGSPETQRHSVNTQREESVVQVAVFTVTQGCVSFVRRLNARPRRSCSVVSKSSSVALKEW